MKGGNKQSLLKWSLYILSSDSPQCNLNSKAKLSEEEWVNNGGKRDRMCYFRKGSQEVLAVGVTIEQTSERWSESFKCLGEVLWC